MAHYISFETNVAYAMERQAKTMKTFDSKEALDENNQLFQKENPLTETTHMILDHLIRHSVVAYGVSWGKVDYISKMTGKGVRTVQRSLKDLEELEIIKRAPYVHVGGKQLGNYILILPYTSKFQEEESYSSVVVKNEVVAETVAYDSVNVAGNVTPTNDVESLQGKGLEVFSTGEAIKPIKTNKTNKPNKPKGVKSNNQKENDEIDSTPIKPIGKDYFISKLFKYGINTILESVNRFSISSTLTHDFLEGIESKYGQTSEQFEQVNPNDIISATDFAIRQATDYFRKGHVITSVKAFFESIFTNEINRKIVARAESYSTSYALVR